jgi:hypothetical protein
MIGGLVSGLAPQSTAFFQALFPSFSLFCIQPALEYINNIRDVITTPAQGLMLALGGLSAIFGFNLADDRSHNVSDPSVDDGQHRCEQSFNVYSHFVPPS